MLLNLGKLRFAIPSSPSLFMELTIDCEETEL